MPKSSYSIIPDSFISVGTGFGILLGLAVGVISGLMLATAPAATPTTVSSSATLDQRQQANVQTLMIQRAGILANVLREQAKKGSAAAPMAILNKNTASLDEALTPYGTAGRRFMASLKNQTQLAQNFVIITANGDTGNATDARSALIASQQDLQRDFAQMVSTMGQPASRLAIQDLTTALTNLAVAAPDATKNYTAEANYVTASNRVVSLLWQYPPSSPAR